MYYKVKYHTKITRKIEDTCNIFSQILTNKTPPEGHTGGLSAVTLLFLQLKLGGKVSGDSPPPPPLPHANPLKNYCLRRGALHRLQK